MTRTLLPFVSVRGRSCANERVLPLWHRWSPLAGMIGVVRDQRECGGMWFILILLVVGVAVFVAWRRGLLPKRLNVSSLLPDSVHFLTRFRRPNNSVSSVDQNRRQELLRRIVRAIAGLPDM